MKSGKPKDAPKVAAPSRDKPNYMRERPTQSTRTSAQAPMIKKRLSK
jgi:hypothetical protein